MTAALLILAKATIVAILGVAAVWLGKPIVLAVFNRADTSERNTALLAAGEKLRGGEWIGLLERLAIYATVLAHYPDGIAVVLVVKALARYPELKAPSTGAAERFIIGTLVSVLFACGMAGLAAWLIGLF